jgi:hypothetical protein
VVGSTIELPISPNGFGVLLAFVCLARLPVPSLKSAMEQTYATISTLQCPALFCTFLQQARVPWTAGITRHAPGHLVFRFRPSPALDETAGRTVLTAVRSQSRCLLKSSKPLLPSYPSPLNKQKFRYRLYPGNGLYYLSLLSKLGFERRR